MTAPPTLPTAPVSHPALDYEELRAEGLRLLGRLAGQQWTDFNVHDPGITILEQLCYALTDLAYRTRHPMADLLAGGAEPGPPGPAEILTGDPVTFADLRKLVLDITGIGEAWVEAPSEPELPCYYHPGSRELRLGADSLESDMQPVELRGLHRVLIQTTDQLSGNAAFEQVAARLHQSRLLAEDFELARFAPCEVGVSATIEIGPSHDATGLLAEILERVEDYLTPPARLLTLAEARARRLDELFNGPRLTHGFFADLPPLRGTVYTSDLVRVILDVPEVRALPSVELTMTSAQGTTRDKWALPVPAGHIAVLARGSELKLVRSGLPVRVDVAAARARLQERRADRARAARQALELAAPPGRDRALARHRSIQRQLPAAYGVGPLGLPASAPAARRAQARQLEAYLLVFDQLLANAFAQLAHAHELLSTDQTGTRSYFAQPVVDPPLRPEELLRDADGKSHDEWLDDHVEPGDPLERRKRWLDHLLARFAERLDEPSSAGPGAGPGVASAGDLGRSVDEAIVAQRQAFLRDYPRLGGARGSGHDVLAEPPAESVLSHRLRLKLGLDDGVRFHVVEHLLLRPVAEDAGQLGEDGEAQIPLLADAERGDPWSLQVSYVLEDPASADKDFEQRVTQTVLAETPAHLQAYLRWLDGDRFRKFETAWTDFRAAYRVYRATKLQVAQVPRVTQWRMRAARDRVIDLLGFARAYPLRDLPLPQMIVAPGSPAAITLEFSQPDVDYQLYNPDGTATKVGDKQVIAPGTGGPLVLQSPPVDRDVNYRVFARKQAFAGDQAPLGVWLRGIAHIEEGIDPSLIARLRLPLLDTRIDQPQPGHARIADYGAQVELEVLASQPGVVYQVIDHADSKRVLSPTVVGTSGTIVLPLGAVTEDIDLRVHGHRAFGDPKNPQLRTAVLDLILPLRVRANPALGATAGAVVACGADATLRLEGTQASASYRVFRRRITDRELVFEPSSTVATIDVAAGGRTVRVRRPQRGALGQDAGFAPAGADRPGSGGPLDLQLASLQEDVVLLVQATKQHATGPLGTGAATLSSSVELEHALAVLVRPDHRRSVRVMARRASQTGPGWLEVRDGQPGVYYELRQSGASAPLGRPVYFHQRDELAPTLNKGIEQLRLEVDFALAADAPGATGGRAETPPAWPRLDVDLAPGTALQVRARKVMTGLEADLDHVTTVERGDG